jgi:hypothetical protein
MRKTGQHWVVPPEEIMSIYAMTEEKRTWERGVQQRIAVEQTGGQL